MPLPYPKSPPLTTVSRKVSSPHTGSFPLQTRIFLIDYYLVLLNNKPMNAAEREKNLNFIFETGKKLRFYMDETVMKGGLPPSCPCSDLTGMQLNAAMMVSMHEPLSLNDLAGRLGVSAPSASVMVDKLVEKEVLLRETDPADRRRVILRIHPRARPDMDQLQERFHAAFDAIARQVGDENIRLWHKVMQKIDALLQEQTP